MKLNIDCVRDIMLWAESITTPTRLAAYVDIDTVDKVKDNLYVSDEEIPVPDSQQKELLSKYSNETLVYHLRYCIEAKLLTEYPAVSDGTTIVILDLTPSGHDFIGNIRKEENFSPVKSIAEKAGVETVNSIIDIGKEVAKIAITKALMG
nr:MAG TPA_asm: Flagellin, PadR, transcription factor, DNA.8A [Caudoviricetes sp.]